MKEWRKYVGLRDKPRYYNNYEVKEFYKGKEKPGPITNEDILEDRVKFYTSEDPEDIFSNVLKPEQRERIDYKILNQKQWEFLHSLYQGLKIKREKIKSEFYQTYRVQVYFQKVNLIILPTRR